MSQRAQTTIDFAIGASVFLLTVAFVFAFVPGLVSPFASGEESAPVVANHIADDLVQDDLAVEGRPYTLRDPLNLDGADVTLDVPRFMDANVTVTDANGVVATRGPTPPADASTSVAWRVVTYQGRHAELRVKVW